MTTTDWTTRHKGCRRVTAEVNGINSTGDPWDRAAPDPAARRARIGRDVRADSSRARRAPPGHRRRPAGARPHRRHRPAHRHPAHGRRHRGAHRPPRTRPSRTSSATHWAAGCAFFTAVKYPDKVGRLVVASAQHPARRDPAEMLAQQGQVNAAAAEFHEGHADVPALPAGRAAPRGLPSAAGQDRARRWPRTSTTPKRFAVSRCRRSSSPPTPTWHRRATTSRPSSCSTAASGTAAGWARAGQRVVTRCAILPGLTHYNLGHLAALRRGHPRLPRRSAELTATSGPFAGSSRHQAFDVR